MNKIVIVYTKNHTYLWDADIAPTDETVDYLIKLGYTDFDLIETPLDLDTYQLLYKLNV